MVGNDAGGTRQHAGKRCRRREAAWRETASAGKAERQEKRTVVGKEAEKDE
ncbi:MAG: hypothetical protein NC409_06755 [Clostridium sp.]|nr:hypothetical protein [Clostridium sp.]